LSLNNYTQPAVINGGKDTKMYVISPLTFRLYGSKNLERLKTHATAPLRDLLRQSHPAVNIIELVGRSPVTIKRAPLSSRSPWPGARGSQAWSAWGANPRWTPPPTHLSFSPGADRNLMYVETTNGIFLQACRSCVLKVCFLYRISLAFGNGFLRQTYINILRSPCTDFCEGGGGGGIDVRLRNRALGPNSGLARPKPICDQSVFFVLISGEKTRTLWRLFASVPNKTCLDNHGKKAACRLHELSPNVYVKNIILEAIGHRIVPGYWSEFPTSTRCFSF
jgi:hypothetical protein